MKNLGILLAIIGSGCATVPAYNPSNYTSENLATLKSYAPPFLKGGFASSISQIYNQDKKLLVGERGIFPSLYNEVQLEAGTYRIVAKCDDSFRFSWPWADIAVEASTNYVVFCTKVISEGKAIFGADKIEGLVIRVVKEEDFSYELFKGTAKYSEKQDSE